VQRLGLVLREGLIFGLLAGVFVLIVRLVGAIETNSITPTMFADLVISALSLLIIGGAGRKLAIITKTTSAAIQMGAIAGGIGELFRGVIADIGLSYLPVGQAAIARMSPAELAAASDTTRLMVNLGLALALAVLFGGMIGWLGAWSLLQFRPPREPRSS
jgi:hypothetical protein